MPGSVGRTALDSAAARCLLLDDAVTSVAMASLISTLQVQWAASRVTAILTALWVEVCHVPPLLASATVCQMLVGAIAVAVCSTFMALAAPLVVGRVTQSALTRDAGELGLRIAL